jgi:hypothetical protein
MTFLAIHASPVTQSPYLLASFYLQFLCQRMLPQLLIATDRIRQRVLSVCNTDRILSPAEEPSEFTSCAPKVKPHRSEVFSRPNCWQPPVFVTTLCKVQAKFGTSSVAMRCDEHSYVVCQQTTRRRISWHNEAQNANCQRIPFPLH